MIRCAASRSARKNFMKQRKDTQRHAGMYSAREDATGVHHSQSALAFSRFLSLSLHHPLISHQKSPVVDLLSPYLWHGHALGLSLNGSVPVLLRDRRESSLVWPATEAHFSARPPPSSLVFPVIDCWRQQAQAVTSLFLFLSSLSPSFVPSSLSRSFSHHMPKHKPPSECNPLRQQQST